MKMKAYHSGFGYICTAPDGKRKDGRSYKQTYLWLRINNEVAVIDSKVQLKRLKKMIDEILT